MSDENIHEAYNKAMAERREGLYIVNLYTQIVERVVLLKEEATRLRAEVATLRERLHYYEAQKDATVPPDRAPHACGTAREGE